MDCNSQPVSTPDIHWMPLEPGVYARPLHFAGDERTLQLWIAPGVTIGFHRHTGFVHAFNVSGQRALLGTDRIADPGDYVYEPPGNQDSWQCVGEVPCIVQISMSGRVEYLDEDGSVVSFTDTPGLRARYLEWCEKNGFGPRALGASS